MHIFKHCAVNALLEVLQKRLKEYFKDDLKGVYIYGSLATGNFNDDTSDVDLLIALKSEVSHQDFAYLNRFHQEIIQAFPTWENRIEIGYASLTALQNYRSQQEKIAIISPGEPFNIKTMGWDWLLNFYSMQYNCIVLWGKLPSDFIAPISQDEFLETVKKQALEWIHWIDQTKESIAYQYYAVLTLCRAFYAVSKGNQASKKSAAAFTKSKLPQWKELIDRALLYRSNLPQENDFEAVNSFTIEIVPIIQKTTQKDVEIMPYSSNWVEQYEQESAKVKAALGESLVAIHHVGSTAVPGLAAKPKIDMIAEVKDLTFDHQGLKDMGYQYQGGFSIPLRRCFMYRSGELDVNLHIFEVNDPEVALNLAFRDYLRTKK